MCFFVVECVVKGLFPLWLVVSSVFLLVRLSGDPVALLAGEYATPELEAALRARFGLDQPLGLQYLIYMQRLSQGDFGTSIISGEPALREVLRRWPATLEVAAVGVTVFFFTLVVVGVHGRVVYGGGRLFRLDLGTLSVASQASVGGPASALAVAVAREWPGLVLPGIIMGLLGYAVGTYLGFGVAYLVRGLPIRL